MINSGLEVVFLRVESNLPIWYEYDKEKKEIVCRPEDFEFVKAWLKDRKLVDITNECKRLFGYA